MSIASPLLSAQCTINAPAAVVWAKLSDLSAMGARSPQCMKMISFGSPNNMVGSLTLNLNRRGPLWWPTFSVITEWFEPRVLEFRIPINGTRWRYTLTEDTTPDGQTVTHVTHERLVQGDTTKLSRALVAIAMGGNESFEQELINGMNQTLAALTQDSEQS
ncbi:MULTISPECIES: SRPBCC family protein [Corynebacterium]|uniref:SRPBCC family protein n=1 Tax=Corynebacterium TaxID=1716 RepID=UPI001CE446CB|nr:MULTISPECIES: SRPBCC family protein [Corynebacterium]